ncbi:unnamed protein product [Brugia pahangi]|uniref:Non-specific serine/threonine protein kinase n=1 Tax=Brugia pahangi TaxID=6280 RepID=A0A0N4TBJ6_BRUPA|nr:unnamed protein product [Brugia pahangi]
MIYPHSATTDFGQFQFDDNGIDNESNITKRLVFKSNTVITESSSPNTISSAYSVTDKISEINEENISDYDVNDFEEITSTENFSSSSSKSLTSSNKLMQNNSTGRKSMDFQMETFKSNSSSSSSNNSSNSSSTDNNSSTNSSSTDNSSSTNSSSTDNSSSSSNSSSTDKLSVKQAKQCLSKSVIKENKFESRSDSETLYSTTTTTTTTESYKSGSYQAKKDERKKKVKNSEENQKHRNIYSIGCSKLNSGNNLKYESISNSSADSQSSRESIILDKSSSSSNSSSTDKLPVKQAKQCLSKSVIKKNEFESRSDSETLYSTTTTTAESYKSGSYQAKKDERKKKVKNSEENQKHRNIYSIGCSKLNSGNNQKYESISNSSADSQSSRESIILDKRSYRFKRKPSIAETNNFANMKYHIDNLEKSDNSWHSKLSDFDNCSRKTGFDRKKSIKNVAVQTIHLESDNDFLPMFTPLLLKDIEGKLFD